MIYPTFFSVVIYFSIGLNPSFVSFILFVIILVLNVLTAQSVGLLISAVMMDVRQAQVLASIWILTSMLISGYYIDPDNTPSFVSPLRALSFIRVCPFSLCFRPVYSTIILGYLAHILTVSCSIHSTPFALALSDFIAMPFYYRYSIRMKHW